MSWALQHEPISRQYATFWKKAKESTSVYPDALSFPTMKAGASSHLISQIECMLTRIPLKGGFSPRRWKHCLDFMILKWSGVTHLDSLRTIALFPADCNYAFKHIGRQMMYNAEKAKALAPEQYGSRKRHRATDLATNKSLTYDILWQRKNWGQCVQMTLSHVTTLLDTLKLQWQWEEWESLSPWSTACSQHSKKRYTR